MTCCSIRSADAEVHYPVEVDLPKNPGYADVDILIYSVRSQRGTSLTNSALLLFYFSFYVCLPPLIIISKVLKWYQISIYDVYHNIYDV